MSDPARIPETQIAALQRQLIENTISELLLTEDFYTRLEIRERLRHQLAHKDPSMDKNLLSEAAHEQLEDLGLW